MGTIEDQKKLTGGKGWKAIKTFSREKPFKVVKDAIKAITPSKELKDKVKKIAKPFVDESVLIRHLTKKDKASTKKTKSVKDVR